MWLVNVQDVMCTKLNILSMHAKISEIIKLVEQCDSGKVTHNAFPVVDCSKTNARLHGIVTLEHIRKVAEDCKQLSDAIIAQIEWVNLLDYSDRSPITIYPHTKVARAFELFRKLGMRHLCVVDNQGILVGIVTRKDLMTFSLEDNIRRCV
jgi:CBS domain-containing protein